MSRQDDEYFGRTDETGPGSTEPELLPEPVPEPEPANAALLTLAEIERRTGISYVTLIRYVRDYRDRLPYEGEGVKRRYYPAAVEEFEKIRAEIAARRMGGQGPTHKSTATKTGAKTGSKGGRKKKRGRGTPISTPSAAHPAPTPSAPAKPKPPVSKIETGASAASVSDLDRMARVYQLRIQRKALDGVLAFVTEQWTRINTEIEELEKP